MNASFWKDSLRSPRQLPDFAVLRCVAASLICGGLLFPTIVRAQATQYKDAPPVLLGAAWYPEQWDEATGTTTWRR
jgi:hypothetical protein